MAVHHDGVESSFAFQLVIYSRFVIQVRMKRKYFGISKSFWQKSLMNRESIGSRIVDKLIHLQSDYGQLLIIIAS